jgi:asparagine synthase (glutamine-hydrolysing)
MTRADGEGLIRHNDDIDDEGDQVTNARVSGGQEPKGLLRQLARRHMPPECVNRRKLGFQLPVPQWLREDWSDLVDDLILGPHVERRGWFQRPALERLVQQHRQGARNDFLLWSLLVLELWLRKTCG